MDDFARALPSARIAGAMLAAHARDAVAERSSPRPAWRGHCQAGRARGTSTTLAAPARDLLLPPVDRQRQLRAAARVVADGRVAVEDGDELRRVAAAAAAAAAPRRRPGLRPLASARAILRTLGVDVRVGPRRPIAMSRARREAEDAGDQRRSDPCADCGARAARAVVASPRVKAIRRVCDRGRDGIASHEGQGGAAEGGSARRSRVRALARALNTRRDGGEAAVSALRRKRNDRTCAASG